MSTPYYNYEKNGFSLVSVLIGIGLVSILTLAISNLVVSGSKGERSVRARYDADEHKNLLTALLSQGPTCKLNLLGVTLPPTGSISTLTVLRPLDSSGSALDSSRAIYENDQQVSNVVKTTSLQLKRIEPASLPDTYISKLLLTFSVDNVVGPTTLVRMISLVLTTDASNKITACQVVSGNIDGGANAQDCGDLKHGQTEVIPQPTVDTLSDAEDFRTGGCDGWGQPYFSCTPNTGERTCVSGVLITTKPTRCNCHSEGG